MDLLAKPVMAESTPLPKSLQRDLLFAEILQLPIGHSKEVTKEDRNWLAQRITRLEKSDPFLILKAVDDKLFVFRLKNPNI